MLGGGCKQGESANRGREEGGGEGWKSLLSARSTAREGGGVLLHPSGYTWRERGHPRAGVPAEHVLPAKWDRWAGESRDVGWVARVPSLGGGTGPTRTEGTGAPTRTTRGGGPHNHHRPSGGGPKRERAAPPAATTPMAHQAHPPKDTFQHKRAAPPARPQRPPPSPQPTQHPLPPTPTRPAAYRRPGGQLPIGGQQPRVPRRKRPGAPVLTALPHARPLPGHREAWDPAPPPLLLSLPPRLSCWPPLGTWLAPRQCAVHARAAAHRRFLARAPAEDMPTGAATRAACSRRPQLARTNRRGRRLVIEMLFHTPLSVGACISANSTCGRHTRDWMRFLKRILRCNINIIICHNGRLHRSSQRAGHVSSRRKNTESACPPTVSRLGLLHGQPHTAPQVCGQVNRACCEKHGRGAVTPPNTPA